MARGALAALTTIYRVPHKKINHFFFSILDSSSENQNLRNICCNNHSTFHNSIFLRLDKILTEFS